MRVALLLALLLAMGAAAAAPSAQAASSTFCPVSTPPYLSLGAGQAGCTGSSLTYLLRVSFFQRAPAANHCAVGKEGLDADSAVIIAVVCGAGSGSDSEVYTSGPGVHPAYPRGRNDTSSGQSGYYGKYYW